MVAKILYFLAIFLHTFGNSMQNDINKISRKTLIQKCCPFGYYVDAGQKCLKYPRTLNFSVTVVGEEANSTEFNKMFALVPSGRFNETDKFRNLARPFQSSSVYILRLTKNGVLQLEVPNAYNRFIYIPVENYCIDYRLIVIDKTKIPNPRQEKGILFWVILPEVQEKVKDYLIVTIATLISCVFLIIVFVVYCLLPELRNIGGLILMAYVASLFIAFTLNSVIRLAHYKPHVCVGLTMAIYYFLLATFCWMNVMSCDIWWTFRGFAKARPIHRRGERFKFYLYSLYAFGLPLPMTIMLNVLNTIDLTGKPWFVQPNIPKYGCFIAGGERMYYLYYPMLVLIAMNWMFFLMTAFNIWRLRRGTGVLDSGAAGTSSANRSQAQRFSIYLKLSVIMGLNWVLEVVNFNFPHVQWLKVTDIYNMLIGVFMFLIFVCKKNILKKLKKRYGHLTYPSTSHTSQDSSAQFSRSPLPSVTDSLMNFHNMKINDENN